MKACMNFDALRDQNGTSGSVRKFLGVMVEVRNLLIPKRLLRHSGSPMSVEAVTHAHDHNKDDCFV